MDTTTPTPYQYPELTTAPLIVDFMQRFKASQQPVKIFLRHGVALNGVITQYDLNHFILVGNGNGQPTVNIVAQSAVATFCVEGQ